MTLRLSGDPAALLAERDRLEELLQSSDDWRALLQLRARRAKGEDLSSLSSSQLEALLLDALADNPFYQRHQRILSEIDSLARTLPAVAQSAPPAPAGPPAAAVVPAPPPVDDLTRVRGIDAALMRRLHALDVWTYEDIADWWASDVHYISSTLGVGSRISAQNWIEQAAMLSMARPGGPRQSAKAKAAAIARAEAEAKAAAEAARLAAEAKKREEAEAIARAASEAAAKKVAEAAARIAAEAKAAAAARAEAEIAARARGEAVARAEAAAKAEAAARAASAAKAEAAARAEAAAKATAAANTDAAVQPGTPEAKRPVVLDPIVIETSARDAAPRPVVQSKPVVVSAAAVPANLAGLMAQFERKAPAEPVEATAQAPAEPQRLKDGAETVVTRAPGSKTPGAFSGLAGIQMPRPVAETIFRTAVPRTTDAGEPAVARDVRPATMDAEIVQPVAARDDRAPPASAVAAAASAPVPRGPADPGSSIDDAIRSAVLAASQKTRGTIGPSGTDLAPRASSDPQAASSRGELLPPISREATPDRMAVRVRERMGEDLAEVIFDHTRYAAYRNKPEEANVAIVRRHRVDAPRALPPPVPAGAIEARPELQKGGATDRFLKALKGN